MLIDLSLARDTAIHENVTFAAMSMHVTEKDYLILSMVGGDQLFSEVDGRVEQAGRIWPSTVEVATDHIAAIVPNDHAIRIQHWHNLEDESVPQKLGLSIVLL